MIINPWLNYVTNILPLGMSNELPSNYTFTTEELKSTYFESDTKVQLCQILIRVLKSEVIIMI